MKSRCDMQQRDTSELLFMKRYRVGCGVGRKEYLGGTRAGGVDHVKCFAEGRGMKFTMPSLE